MLKSSAKISCKLAAYNLIVTPVLRAKLRRVQRGYSPASGDVVFAEPETANLKQDRGKIVSTQQTERDTGCCNILADGKNNSITTQAAAFGLGEGSKLMHEAKQTNQLKYYRIRRQSLYSSLHNLK